MSKENLREKYWKLAIFPDGMSCPRCNGVHFHPHATVLPNLHVSAPDPKGKDGKTNLWIARSDCLSAGCDGFIDWTFHPDYCGGNRAGNEFRGIVEWGTNPLGLELYKDYPRSVK